MEKLEQTVDLMLSENYKDRFEAEFYQLKIRIEKLENYIAKIYVKKDDFFTKRDYNIEILEKQLLMMKEYFFLLKQRSILEHIDIL